LVEGLVVRVGRDGLVQYLGGFVRVPGIEERRREQEVGVRGFLSDPLAVGLDPDVVAVSGERPGVGLAGAA
jgi:hypothetical protein